MQQDEGTFRGSGGTELFFQRWRPDGEPKGSLAIVHGLGEHSGRYGNLVNHLVPQGYALYGLDLRGHGRSPGARGHVARWADHRADVRALIELVQRSEPGRPLFLFGHSMGGLIVLNSVLHDPSGLRGVVVSAPGLDTGGLSPTMLRVATLLSRVAPALPMPTGLDATGISRDEAEVRAYQLDKRVHAKGSPRAAVEGSAAIHWTLEHAAELRLPLFLYYGTADRIVPTTNSRRFFEAAGSEDKTLREYAGGYHESHNDLHRADLFAELTAWLDGRL